MSVSSSVHALTHAREQVIREYPKYYDDILEKAMERLENIVRSNASYEVRMQQLSLRADILRNKNAKGLGTQKPKKSISGKGDAKGPKESNAAESLDPFARRGSWSVLQDTLAA